MFSLVLAFILESTFLEIRSKAKEIRSFWKSRPSQGSLGALFAPRRTREPMSGELEGAERCLD